MVQTVWLATLECFSNRKSAWPDHPYTCLTFDDSLGSATKIALSVFTDFFLYFNMRLSTSNLALLFRLLLDSSCMEVFSNAIVPEEEEY